MFIAMYVYTYIARNAMYVCIISFSTMLLSYKATLLPTYL